MRIPIQGIPEVWYCEECEKGNEKLSSLSPSNGKGEVLLHKSPFDTSSKVHVYHLRTPEKHYLPNSVHYLETGEASYAFSRATSGQPIFISEKDAIQTLSEKNTMVDSMHKELSLYFLKHFSHAKMAKMVVDLETAEAPLVFQDFTSGQQNINSEHAVLPHLVEHTQEISLHKDQIMESLNVVESAKMTEIEAAMVTPKASNVSSTSASGQQIVNSGDSNSASPLRFLPKVDNCLYVPALDASWKGIFKILNAPKHVEISYEMKAHNPSQCLKKVYMFAKQMPEVLNFELVKHGNLWTNLFGNYCPDRRDIGLYFFPSKGGRDESYISLLNFIGAEDLVMRKYMDGIELLVFTSKLLHEDHQKWDGMFYLWGLFHRVKEARAAIEVNVPGNHNGGDNPNAVDMVCDEYTGKNESALSPGFEDPGL